MRFEVIKSVGLGTVLMSFVADQIFKSWAHSLVSFYGVIRIIPGLDIVAINNSGMAFGLAGGSSPWILIVVGLFLSGWLLLWMLRTSSPVLAVGLGLAVGGALGNVSDRLLLGAVRDYIDLHWKGIHWPAFNLADVAIVTGLTVLVLFSEESDRRRKTPRALPSRNEAEPARTKTR